MRLAGHVIQLLDTVRDPGSEIEICTPPELVNLESIFSGIRAVTPSGTRGETSGCMALIWLLRDHAVQYDPFIKSQLAPRN